MFASSRLLLSRTTYLVTMINEEYTIFIQFIAIWSRKSVSDKLDDKYIHLSVTDAQERDKPII